MQPIKISLPAANPLVEKYLHQFSEVSSFFSYAPFERTSVEQRIDWLDRSMEKRADRQRLIDILLNYNQTIGNGEASLKAIEKLADEHSVCVVGGQQAGVLTGPLLTIYKAISIVRLARKEEALLGRPVVPVFWIAGEDHDLEEVNHLYVLGAREKAEKIRYGGNNPKRISASHWPLNADDHADFIEQLIQYWPDSEWKKGIVNKLSEITSECKNFAEWFARVMAWLFKDEGLVFIDSADPQIRRLESSFLKNLVHQCRSLHEQVSSTTDRLIQQGYQPQVVLSEKDVHLFLYEQGERCLLQWNGNSFESKVTKTTFTEAELVRIAEQEPERLSTNVIFRPLLQDYLFPTLYAVLGHAEIAYWAMLGQAFAAVGMQMPILYPRIGVTLVDEALTRTMEQCSLSMEDILLSKKPLEDLWIEEQEGPGWSAIFEAVKTNMVNLYEPVIQQITENYPGLSQLGTANIERLLEQISFMENKTNEEIRKKHEVALQRIARLKNHLLPNSKLQERVYNIFPVLVRYGPQAIHKLVSADYDLNGEHHIITL